MKNNLNKKDSTVLMRLKKTLGFEGKPNEEFFNFYNFVPVHLPQIWFQYYLNSKGLNRILKNQEKWYKENIPPYEQDKRKGHGVQYIYNAAKQIKPRIYNADIFTQQSHAFYPHIAIVGNTTFFKDYTEPDFAKGHEMFHVKMPYWAEFQQNGPQLKVLERNTNTAPGHDSEPEEKIADIWGLKYLLWKNGIYDSTSDEDAKLEHIKELRKRFPNLRPLQQMDNEELLFQINHVAYKDNDKEVNRNNIV